MIGKFKNIQSCNHSLLNHNIRQARTHSFIHSTIQSILLTLFRDNLMNKIVFLLFIVTFYSFITLAQEDIHIGTTPCARAGSPPMEDANQAASATRCCVPRSRRRPRVGRQVIRSNRRWQS